MISPPPSGANAEPRTASDPFWELPPGVPTRALRGSVDRLESFQQPILGIRWATTAASVVLSATELGNLKPALMIGLALMMANAIYRSFHPLKADGSSASKMLLLLEFVLAFAVVAITGYWDSSLVFTTVAAVIIAGFARGFGFSLQVGVALGIGLSVPYLQGSGWNVDRLDQAGQWFTLLLLVGAVAGYGRRVRGEVDLKHSIAIDRVSQLSDANNLLFNLHKVAQTLPASLDQDEVLESSLGRLRSLVKLDSVAILTKEDVDGAWVVARKQSMNIRGALAIEDFPKSAQRAVRTKAVVIVDDAEAGTGFAVNSRSAIYAPLMARGAMIGLLAVEADEASRFSLRDREVIQGYVEPVALAIDNAKWFSRLKTVSADEERTRIARDLHDRIGQSLAYLGFELDRVVRKNDHGEPVGDHLGDLRADLRGVITEVRETLYDLRTDVALSKDFAATTAEFSARLAERSGLEVVLDCDSGARLPILQEREMWRITQEALINVERHADAKRVQITWRCDGSQAMLDVTDDGHGFVIDSAGRLDSYGILGMRERASSIGATLEVTSVPQEGTTVRCFLTQE